MACDPEIHRRLDVEKVHDIAFVGNIFPGPRAELIALLQRRFRSMFVGRAYFEEMAKTYSAARLVFNRSLKNDVNMRVFEAVACGSLLLTNELGDNGQAELFRDGVHLATYRDADELLDKAAYYLKHDVLRERIAAAGRAEAIARHTYRHRMQTLLERVSRGVPRARTRQQEPTSSGTRRSTRLLRVCAARALGTRPGIGQSGCSMSAAAPVGWARRSKPANRPGSWESRSSQRRPLMPAAVWTKSSRGTWRKLELPFDEAHLRLRHLWGRAGAPARSGSISAASARTGSSQMAVFSRQPAQCPSS